jgi:hypothetical protein
VISYHFWIGSGKWNICHKAVELLFQKQAVLAKAGKKTAAPLSSVYIGNNRHELFSMTF